MIEQRPADFEGSGPASPQSHEFRPLVSIVIPVYNGSDYVAKAIESALAQTYAPVEVVVVNDGSRDDGRTEAVVNRYADQVRYVTKPNGGVATALNLGIEQARGEFISWLSHDDEFTADKLRNQVEAYRDLRREFGDTFILYGDYDVINEQSTVIGRQSVPAVRGAGIRRELIRDYPVNGCTTLVPKRCFTEIGGFDSGRPTTQDYHLWFRTGDRYPFVHLPGIGMRARAHPNQGTFRISGRQAECEDLYCWMVREFRDEELGPLTEPSSIAEEYLRMAQSLMDLKAVYLAAGIALDRSQAWAEKCTGVDRRRLLKRIRRLRMLANSATMRRWAKRMRPLVQRVRGVFRRLGLVKRK